MGDFGQSFERWNLLSFGGGVVSWFEPSTPDYTAKARLAKRGGVRAEHYDFLFRD
jgi:hypothetical protein